MILLLTPPFVQLNTPYPATPQLAGFLASRGFAVAQRDLSLETALEALVRWGGDFADEAIEVLRNPFLEDDAKIAMTGEVERLAAWIRDNVDGDFGFSRYAERLGVAVPDFSAVVKRLKKRTEIDEIIAEKTAEALEEVRPDVVGVTCPFPGTLLGAFRIAETVRRLAPGVRLVLGGGYVNTELRDMDDERPGDYFDAVMYDEGYAPWLEYLEMEGVKPRKGAAVPLSAPVPPFVKPSYEGLDLSRYVDLPESENPMHRLWSTGRWLKLQMARGCYWGKCAFCDVSLEYIRSFAMPKAAEVADAMEALAEETGLENPGFHFTDEAMPPALAKGVAKEIIARGFRCRWWGNVRFDAAYGEEEARLMAESGCIAVTGGLECATDRLLKLMNKGITVESARRALKAFSRAGIMAHAYLMYAFPTQTEREAVRALGTVRSLFREGLVQSAFFHRFALTVHSPVAADPGKFGIKPFPPSGRKGRIFARNEIGYEEPGAPDWDAIGRGLKLALYNFMRGAGFSKPLSFWFEAGKRRPLV